MSQDETLPLFPPHMSIDVRGRVRNTNVSRSQAVLPLFEAVVNSIQSILDYHSDKAAQKGKITITIRRERPILRLPGIGGPLPIPNIRDIEIQDNGTGFTPANYSAFCTADTTAKLAQGGKGIGRFSWLAVFMYATVESVYEDDLEKRKRTFEFRPTHNGIEAQTEAKTKARRQTRITLKGVRPEYAESLRKTSNNLAERIFEHCLDYIVLKKCPSMYIVDTDSEGNPETTDILALKSNIITVEKPTNLTVAGNPIALRHITQQCHGSNTDHMVHLCAHHRVVESFRMSAVSDVPSQPFREDGFHPTVKTVYVSSEVLDKHVDPTRTRIDLPDSAPVLEATGYFGKDLLKSKLGDHLNTTYQTQIDSFRNRNLTRIETYIKTHRPDLTPLLVAAEHRLATITATDASALDMELFRVQQEWEREIQERRKELEQQIADLSTDPDELHQATRRIMAEIKSSEQVSLTQYVAKRKAVLTLLRGWMSRYDDGPAKEAAFHELIFPRFKSNREVGYTQHNLWLIDTSFSFYEFLTSDITFKKTRAPVDSSKRPDILAFRTGGSTSSYRSIAIIEIKRPERTDSNPVTQLLEYAQDLRNGEAFTADGIRIPPVNPAVMIDTYAIVTLSPKMKEMLRVSPGNLVPADSDGKWWGYQSILNVRIQVFDYSELVSNAESQNFPFFKELGL